MSVRISIILTTGTMATVCCDKRTAYLLVPLLFGIYLVVHRRDILTKNIDEFGNTTRPEVKIPQGIVRGVNMVTRNNRNVYGFMGIPFAQPPVGNLRFEAPLPAGAWNGILDAGSDSPECVQSAGTNVKGDEDCLYLHVYTPRLPTDGNSTLLPVMVFIHGGAFRMGNNDPEKFGPYYLLDKDVVLVVPSYRLGVFGFLSTGDEVVPGNNGLKDLVKALEWNRDNIQYFGGDPNRVTIFGESAGGMIVHLLVLSNLTNGLIHRFITESGSALSYDPQRPRQVLANRTIQLGEYLGCPIYTSTALVNCLRSLNTSKLIDTDSIYSVWNNYPSVIWSPTIEPDIEGAFITDRPENLFASGKIRHLPSISLTNQNEGILGASKYYQDPDSFDDFLNQIDVALPPMLTYDTLVDDVSAYTAALKSYYFNDLTANRTSLLYNMTLLQHDAVVAYPTYRAIQKQLDYTNNTQYVCTFEYLGTFSSTYKVTGGVVEGFGSTHMDELIYLFRQSRAGPGSSNSEKNEADYKIVDTMVQLWTSFAATGKPTTGDPNTNEIWKPYTSQKNYLRIGNYSDTSIGVEYNYFEKRMQFWEELTAGTSWK